MSSYVIITPAKNEAQFIENTIISVISQTVLPLRWIIVSDASTDGTDEIVQKYTAQYPFIRLLRFESIAQRSFSSKAFAFNFGYNTLKNLDYDFIGNLDADIELTKDYYEKILYKFLTNEYLGIAGGVRQDLINGKFIKINTSRNSVAGGFQLFRRKCFEDIGGYKPLKYGGIDALAEINARMLKWKVESFEENITFHHRLTGSTTEKNLLKQRYVDGIKNYLIGYHPLFFIFRFIFKLYQKPVIIGSIATFIGYFGAALRKVERPVSKELIKYLRTEQINRMKNFIWNHREYSFKN